MPEAGRAGVLGTNGLQTRISHRAGRISPILMRSTLNYLVVTPPVSVYLNEWDASHSIWKSLSAKQGLPAAGEACQLRVQSGPKVKL